MRIVTDIEEARRLLTRRPAYEEPALPLAAAKRTEAIFDEPLRLSTARPRSRPSPGPGQLLLPLSAASAYRGMARHRRTPCN